MGVAAWSLVIACLFVAGLLVLPKLFGMDVLSIYSGSMSPAIDTGDAVIVRTVLSADLRPGDIVVYRPANDPSVLITHRIVSIDYNEAVGDYAVVTKGDANDVPDPRWRAAPNDSFGKVVLTLPLLGRALDALSGTRGKVLALLALIVFVVAGSVSRRRAQRVAGSDRVAGADEAQAS